MKVPGQHVPSIVALSTTFAFWILLGAFGVWWPIAYALGFVAGITAVFILAKHHMRRPPS